MRSFAIYFIAGIFIVSLSMLSMPFWANVCGVVFIILMSVAIHAWDDVERGLDEDDKYRML